MNEFTVVMFAATLLAGIVIQRTPQQPVPAPATSPAPAPPRFGPTPEQQAATQADHQHLLELLKIKSLRPGANGNPSAPDAANSDESRATTYTALPDPLVFKNGKKVTDAKQWEQRRKELFEEFDREIYGRVPKKTPRVTWEVMETISEQKGSIPVITRKLLGHVDNASYPAIKVDIALTVTTPAAVTKPVPVMMEFGFVFPTRPGAPAFTPPAGAGPDWQEQLVTKGWGYAVLSPTSFQADNGAGLREGIIGLVNHGQPRKIDDWGTLRAWAWGASRALDYLEKDTRVDATRVGIEGLSRYGKATLVAMAYEPRFAIGFVGSSGAGGAKLYRRDFGEKVENLASSGEYHWMAGNFLKYAGPLTPSDLPIDSHELIALCAPRPVFVSCGSPTNEGNWVDSRGQFLATVAAGPVYTLLGKKDLGTAEMPAIEAALVQGDLAFRQHSGGHTTGPNWPTFLQFADRYFSDK